MVSNFFGKNLVFLRSISNLSQQGLADAVGLNRGNIDSYERGSQPKPELMLRIANYFCIELQTLIAVELDSSNYLKHIKSDSIPVFDGKEDAGPASQKSTFIKSQFLELMSDVKVEKDETNRAKLVEEAILMVCRLEDEANHLKTELLGILRRQVK